MSDAPHPVLHARPDPALGAVVIARHPLLYADGADASLDRPLHVRAGSGLCWWRDQLAIAQDDAAFLALLDPSTGHVGAIPLPPRAGQRLHDKQRGNKHVKYDLESVLAWEGGLILFGSGSTPARQTLVCVDPHGEVSLFDAAALYEALRGWRAFAGPELNLEGVALRGDELLLLQRGNGAPVAGESRVDAICSVSWPQMRAWMDRRGEHPRPGGLVRFELGLLDGVRLTFTDAEVVGERLYYLAAAEDSPDAYDDGPVTGMVLGRLDEDGPRFARILDEQGAPLQDKGEGLALRAETPDRAWVVTDADDPDRPADLLELRLTGPW